MIKKTGKIIGIAMICVALLLAAGYIYKTFFRPTYRSENNVIAMLIIGLILGGIIVYLLLRLTREQRNRSETVTESHTVVERMKQVFKIVVAEGQLNEIYNYENTKKLLKFIPSTKKALVIVRGKVMVGYDIEKCRWEIDEERKVLRLIEFPKPEILSIDTDFNYYYFEDDLFNFIGRKDLQEIQVLAKEQVKRAALQSGLTKIAADQMKLLLEQVVVMNRWKLENSTLIDDYHYPVYD